MEWNKVQECRFRKRSGIFARKKTGEIFLSLIIGLTFEELNVVSILFSGFWEIFTISLRISSISLLFSSVSGFTVTGVLSAFFKGSSISLLIRL